MSRSLVSSLGRLALQGLQRLPSCFSGNLVRSWGGFPFLAISHSSNKPRQAGGQIQHFKCSNPDGPQTGVVGTPSEDHQTHKVRALTSCGLRSVVLLLLHVGTLGPLGDKTANVNPPPKQNHAPNKTTRQKGRGAKKDDVPRCKGGGGVLPSLPPLGTLAPLGNKTNNLYPLPEPTPPPPPLFQFSPGVLMKSRG